MLSINGNDIEYSDAFINQNKIIFKGIDINKLSLINTRGPNEYYFEELDISQSGIERQPEVQIQAHLVSEPTLTLVFDLKEAGE